MNWVQNWLSSFLLQGSCTLSWAQCGRMVGLLWANCQKPLNSIIIRYDGWTWDNTSLKVRTSTCSGFGSRDKHTLRWEKKKWKRRSNYIWTGLKASLLTFLLSFIKGWHFEEKPGNEEICKNRKQCHSSYCLFLV